MIRDGIKAFFRDSGETSAVQCIDYDSGMVKDHPDYAGVPIDRVIFPDEEEFFEKTGIMEFKFLEINPCGHCQHQTECDAKYICRVLKRFKRMQAREFELKYGPGHQIP